jgi:hypothetical protein
MCPLCFFLSPDTKITQYSVAVIARMMDFALTKKDRSACGPVLHSRYGAYNKCGSWALLLFGWDVLQGGQPLP